MKIFILLAFVVFVVVALTFLKGFLVSSGGVRYKRRDFLSAAELRFFQALSKVVAGRAVVFSKVRLADLAEPAALKNSSAWWKAFGSIKSKHVDFCLSDLNGRILCAIELDDSSHSRPDRVKRDDLVDGVFKDIGLPVYHVPGRASYAPVDFKMLDKVLALS